MRSNPVYAVAAILIIALNVTSSARAMDIAVNVPMNKIVKASSNAKKVSAPTTLPIPQATATTTPTQVPTSTPKPTATITPTPRPSATPTPTVLTQKNAGSSAKIATTSAAVKPTASSSAHMITGSFSMADVRQPIMTALIILHIALFVVFIKTFTPLHTLIRTQYHSLKKAARRLHKK
ncbi:hypothetical protein HYS00_02785 [Candidatus Microgenomates bacterium]|nr:hypothetical protein [Candidatus Microgenomates bacterium]